MYDYEVFLPRENHLYLEIKLGCFVFVGFVLKKDKKKAEEEEEQITIEELIEKEVWFEYRIINGTENTVQLVIFAGVKFGTFEETCVSKKFGGW